jgi:hypothetical protein
MSTPAFDCVACGACCFSRNPRYLVLLPEDRERPLPPHALFEDGGRTFVDFSCGRCTHLRLEAGRAICGVYENRPEACRAFRAGSFECLKAIRANGVMGEKVRQAGVA